MLQELRRHFRALLNDVDSGGHDVYIFATARQEWVLLSDATGRVETTRPR